MPCKGLDPAPVCPLQQAATLPTSMPHSRAHAVWQIDKSEVTSVLFKPVCTMLCTLHICLLQGS